MFVYSQSALMSLRDFFVSPKNAFYMNCQKFTLKNKCEGRRNEPTQPLGQKLGFLHPSWYSIDRKSTQEANSGNIIFRKDIPKRVATTTR